MRGWVVRWIGIECVGGWMDEGWPLPEVLLCWFSPGLPRKPLSAVPQGLVTATHEPGMAPSWQRDG